MTINQKLTKIQTEFKSKKSRFNSFGKYNFRSAEDILEATKPFLKELNVTVIVDEELISFDPPVMKCTAVISDGENSIQTSAVVGASSYGKKYCLGNLFLIDDTQDADATNGHGKKQEVKIAISAQQLQKAKDYVKSGGKVAAIKAKYNLTKEIEQELSTL